MSKEKTFDSASAIDYGGTYVVDAQGQLVRQGASSTSATNALPAVAEAAPGAAEVGMATPVDGVPPARAKALGK